ncbi:MULTISPECIES: hypothetical protein [Devosia]|uniref:DUF2147 domain-containing protein n=1 Tax=Devosia equisanguinis TaxID=2490941 RepID=A0A3S4CTM5_9HYPH|nr:MULTISPECIES: hypothetical protein [Devosia]ODT49640.1 MAG: hypothetical protein ABS74_07090 [Pelagibacterium sp. SCN 63-126]ODU87654.1 MAG: hypothetical protein ABT14_04680 [Pelagibacterium sp. SCN 63-17]OJX45655.1 MAG: hypothetical protein BGO80_07660 [Devosia sp. 63-57]VDS05602.1 hypothetical protein DEVEQU_02744 [Devosia equisanguinis]
MRRFALCLAITALSAAPALAQTYQGNWSCRDATTNRAGILTIYGNVYGWASRTVGDPNSGTGTLTPYQDGVGLNDGNLRANAGIQAGRTVSDPTYGVALQLETAQAIVMLCTPR